MRILFVADLVGRPGRRVARALLPHLREERGADVVIANGENLAAGFGVTGATVSDLLDMGVDVVTSGNHIWDRHEGLSLLESEHRLLRPANYPPGNPGSGSHVVEAPAGKVAVLNLQGRVFMPALDDPFRVGRALVDQLRADTNIIVVDFHAEATAEKEAFARYVDGRCAAVIGTHTHVPTADETILPGGTAFITDIGMCGPVGGVIGTQLEPVLTRVVGKLPARFEVQKGPCRCDGVFLIIDEETGSAQRVLDGALTPFIWAGLRWQREQRAGGDTAADSD